LLYPVQYGSPALHSDTLEDSEHGESNIIEAGDARVWSLPVLRARRDIRVTHVGPEWSLSLDVRVAWARLLALLYDYIYNTQYYKISQIHRGSTKGTPQKKN